MGLYRNVDRVLTDLAASGIDTTDRLTVDDLTQYDQYHYEGTDAVDDAIFGLGANDSTNILDVGSGLGGPARYMAQKCGTKVTALELQTDLHQLANDLTSRCQLQHLVTHSHGDILTGIAGVDRYDGLVSMLCFLHIPDRATLLARCAQALKPNGKIFIDDYFARSPLTASDSQMLAESVFCSYLPDLATYRSDLEGAGFTSITIVDKTKDWTEFVASRYSTFASIRSELEHRYGRATVAQLDHFYQTVAALFQAGNLGGLRLTATVTKPTHS